MLGEFPPNQKSAGVFSVSAGLSGCQLRKGKGLAR